MIKKKRIIRGLPRVSGTHETEHMINLAFLATFLPLLWWNLPLNNPLDIPIKNMFIVGLLGWVLFKRRLLGFLVKNLETISYITLKNST